MDTTKPLLSGRAAFIVGTIGGLAATASVFVPSPWGTLVAIVGFILCVLAGVAAKPPQVVEGKPVLQGTALTVGGSLLAALTQAFPMLPHGWPQSLALGAAGLLAWLTGRALPALSSKPVAEAKALEVAAEVKTLDDAAKVMKGPPA